MATNDTNTISPVESFPNIVIPQEKKEKKKNGKKPFKSTDNTEKEQNTSGNNQLAIMAGNDKHLLDFKA